MKRAGLELPDKALLGVMKLLDRQFVARVASSVCRQWRRVARDPSLWRNADLRLDVYSTAVHCGLLRMVFVASALRELTITFHGDSQWARGLSPELAFDALLTSSCQFESITFMDYHDKYFGFVTAFLPRQQAAKKLYLSSKGWPKANDPSACPASGIWKAVECMRLADLSVSGDHLVTSPYSFSGGELGLALESVSIKWSPSEPLVVSLIRACSATLKRASLGTVSRGILRALTECGILEKLSVPASSEGMSLLQSCPRLQDLEIDWSRVSSKPGQVAAASEFLRRGQVPPALRRLQVSDLNEASDAVLGSVCALGRLGQLTSLEVHSAEMYMPKLLPRILSSLPSLETLTLFDCNVGYTELMHLTKPGIAPRLAKLLIQDCVCTFSRRWKWCRKRALPELEVRRPGIEYSEKTTPEYDSDDEAYLQGYAIGDCGCGDSD